MYFTSNYFLLAIYPFTLVVFWLLQRFTSGPLALSWLALSSFLIYAWWDSSSVPLLIISVVTNYCLGEWIHRVQETAHRHRTLILSLGIAFNLLALAYYKYATFLASITMSSLSISYEMTAESIPLGISFLTFVQIAYLVDVSRQSAARTSFLHYSLLVIFFPKIIAGPITRQKPMIAQLHALEHPSPLIAAHVAEGVMVFGIGVFKKVVLADHLSLIGDPVFAALSLGTEVSAAEAWIGILAYSFQLYFDFSGYTDMAIGLAQTFGITLPQNFNSPYRATSIIDFWRRWHLTFSSFLRDFLYIPLGGNRKGAFRQYVNLLITMILGGLWHGASWTFVIWGTLHGLYLIVNHLWKKTNLALSPWFSWALTFLSIVFAWGWFRVENVETGGRLCTSLIGHHGLFPEGMSLWTFLQAMQKPSPTFEYLSSVFHDIGLAVSLGHRTFYLSDILFSDITLTVGLFVIAAAISFFCPTTESWIKPQRQPQSTMLTFRRAILIGLLFYAAFLASINAEQGSFIYRQF